jgi:hypothetical protein
VKDFIREWDLPRKLPPIGDGECEVCKGDGVVGCAACDGAGSTSCGRSCCNECHKCEACGGNGDRSCSGCRGSGASAHVRAVIVGEANRLWRRDIGRGITTGAKELYIGFAIDGLRDGEIRLEAT